MISKITLLIWFWWEIHGELKNIIINHGTTMILDGLMIWLLKFRLESIQESLQIYLEHLLWQQIVLILKKDALEILLLLIIEMMKDIQNHGMMLKMQMRIQERFNSQRHLITETFISWLNLILKMLFLKFVRPEIILVHLRVLHFQWLHLKFIKMEIW